MGAELIDMRTPFKEPIHEYNRKRRSAKSFRIIPNQKIRVFIRACLKKGTSSAKSTGWQWRPNRQKQEKKHRACHIWWQFYETI